MAERYERIVFCDFDGTITAEETFAGMLKHFAGAHYEEVESLIVARKLTLREGLRRLVELIPSQHYPQILEYVCDKEIRAGFSELLEFLRLRGIPFIVISGGLRGSVTAGLKPYTGLIHAVHAADVDTTGEYLKIISQFEGEFELIAKAEVMSLYDFEESICIGDGISDLNMALHSSVVFARDSLSRYLETEGKPHIKWNDFFDVIRFLATYR